MAAEAWTNYRRRNDSVIVDAFQVGFGWLCMASDSAHLGYLPAQLRRCCDCFPGEVFGPSHNF